MVSLLQPSFILPHSYLFLDISLNFSSAISVIAMTGAAIVIDDAAAADTIRSVKQRVFVANHELPVRRQRLVYRPGPRGMEALADDETLGGAGVARDGTAELDVLLAELLDTQFEIYVKTLAGKIITLEVESSDTILDLKYVVPSFGCNTFPFYLLHGRVLYQHLDDIQPPFDTCILYIAEPRSETWRASRWSSSV